MRHLVDFILTLLIISMITYAVFQVLPGDPALLMLGTEASEDSLQALRDSLGLNEPFLTRYWHWFTHMLQGDLGISYRYNLPVVNLIGEHFTVTCQLSLYSMVLALLISFPAGIIAAICFGKWADRIISGFAYISMAIPAFWLGILFILLFAVVLKSFSTSGYIPWRTNPLACLRTLTLPAIALAIPRAAIFMRFIRAAILEEQGQNYVRTAKAKGLSKMGIMFNHILQNTYISLITVIGLHMGSLLAGAIVVEQVFVLPGLGQLLLSAIAVRDLPLLQGLVFVIALVIVTINMATDWIYQWLDPRLRGDEQA